MIFFFIFQEPVFTHHQNGSDALDTKVNQLPSGH